MNPSPSIVGLSDIEALERVPLEQRDLPSSTYELLQRSAQRHGQRIALSCLLHGSAAEEPLRISYAELFARVTQTANALHRLGLESHQAVSFLLPNLPQTHYVIWGGEAAGIVNAINPLLEPEHIAELIRASNTRVLVTLAPFPGTDLWQKVAGLRAQLPELYAIVVVDPANLLPAPQREALKAQRGPLPEGVLDFDTLIADCPADRLESGRAIHPDDVASYFHTGGTTGTPKLAPHSHFNEVAMAEIMGLNADYGVDDVLLCGLPLFHVNGVMVTGLAPFHRGAQVLLAGPQGYRNPTLIQDFLEAGGTLPGHQLQWRADHLRGVAAGPQRWPRPVQPAFRPVRRGADAGGADPPVRGAYRAQGDRGLRPHRRYLRHQLQPAWRRAPAGFDRSAPAVLPGEGRGARRRGAITCAMPRRTRWATSA